MIEVIALLVAFIAVGLWWLSHQAEHASYYWDDEE